MQHRVNASFYMLFEESGEAGMFSSDDHRFQQEEAKRPGVNVYPCHSCLSSSVASMGRNMHGARLHHQLTSMRHLL